MTAEQTEIAPPSHDALAEAARQIGAAYPGLYDHQRAGIAFLLARRRAILADDMGLGKTRQAIIAAREAAPEGPYLVICPAAVKLNWRREIRLVEPDADVQVIDGGRALEDGRRWTIVNYDLLRPGRGAPARHGLGRHRRRRGPLHQERQPAQRASTRAARRTQGTDGGRRARGRVPPDGHADVESTARPVQPAEGGPPPPGDQLLQLRQAVLRGLRQRLRAGHQRRVEPRRAGRDHLRGVAATDQGRGARSPAEAQNLAAGRDQLEVGRQPGGASARLPGAASVPLGTDLDQRFWRC